MKTLTAPVKASTGKTDEFGFSVFATDGHLIVRHDRHGRVVIDQAGLAKLHRRMLTVPLPPANMSEAL